jgi:predicted MFS family arabinose efflux permease
MSVEAIDARHEIPVIGTISFGHLLSHLYMLAIPPLFPLLRNDFAVGYVELGLTITAYAVTTGLLQTPVGFLVNRIGGQRVLAGGLFLNALAIALTGVATHYWQLVALMLLAGAGSSVFHPADYSILTARISTKRLGRALSAHTLAGNFGFLVAPPLMVTLAALAGWRVSVMVIGALGMAVAVALLFMSAILSGVGQTKARQADSWRALLTSPKIMLLFVFYVLSSAANSGMVHFSVVAFKDIYHLPVTVTAVALTAYQGLAFSCCCRARVACHFGPSSAFWGVRVPCAASSMPPVISPCGMRPLTRSASAPCSASSPRAIAAARSSVRLSMAGSWISVAPNWCSGPRRPSRRWPSAPCWSTASRHDPPEPCACYA